MASWIIIWGVDDSVRETALIGIVTLAGTVVCGYLGFASWDDKNFMSIAKDKKQGNKQEEGVDV